MKFCTKIIARAQGWGGARDGLLPMRTEELEAQLNATEINYLVYLGTWQHHY